MLPIDDALAARANLLGVGISAIDLKDALCRSSQLLQQRRKGYICVTGVHGIMEAQRDPSFRAILNRSFLCTPDGMPTVWVGRMQGHRRMRRVYGPDFMLGMCRLSVEKRYRHFLYGGNPGVAEKLKRCVETMLPGIDIVGTHTPPFRALTPTEEDQLMATVASVRPDIIWVGLSTPKQERFMASMIDRLDTCLMVGVGAAFDIHAGLLADAPTWMKGAGLQWLHRLLKEPRRLWRRYLVNNPRFLWDISLQLAGIRKFKVELS
ncbi:MAG: WecB/TagA/CpsF family glycosyltransferase [Candidatus Korobacteraceae bacterium]|jgi:N-acetylglucosaminyldiphosphoundecaprenol N-acetyl-beta-D-mannosaminyltransferase